MSHSVLSFVVRLVVDVGFPYWVDGMGLVLMAIPGWSACGFCGFVAAFFGWFRVPRCSVVVRVFVRCWAVRCRVVVRVGWVAILFARCGAVAVVWRVSPRFVVFLSWLEFVWLLRPRVVGVVCSAWRVSRSEFGLVCVSGVGVVCLVWWSGWGCGGRVVWCCGAVGLCWCRRLCGGGPLVVGGPGRVYRLRVVVVNVGVVGWGFGGAGPGRCAALVGRVGWFGCGCVCSPVVVGSGLLWVVGRGAWLVGGVGAWVGWVWRVWVVARPVAAFVRVFLVRGVRLFVGWGGAP